MKFLAAASLTTSSRMPWALAARTVRPPSVAPSSCSAACSSRESPSVMVHIGQLHVLTGGILNGRGQLCHDRAALCVRRRHVEREQLPQRVHAPVQLGALRVLVPVPACPRPALGRARFLVAACGQAQHGARVVRQRLEAACCRPASDLLIHRCPFRPLRGLSLRRIDSRWRQAVGHLLSRRAHLNCAAQPVERVAKIYARAGQRPRATGTDTGRPAPIPRRTRRSGAACKQSSPPQAGN